MKKVLCLACGLVNLDKFTTYPYCAACGVHLPETPVPKWRAFWLRPVRPLYWATTVGAGVAVLAIGGVGVMRDTRDPSPNMLVVYVQVPRAPSQNGLLSVRFTLDSTEENSAQSFEAVRLRLAREMEQNFVLVDLQPNPQTSEDSGVGQYFTWQRVSRVSELQLVLKPRRSGKLKLEATIAARGYAPFTIERIVYAPLEHPKKEK